MSEAISGDAGRIGFLIKGDYSEDKTYNFLDVVFYKGSSYVAKKETKGNTPAENNEYWQILASGLSGDFASKAIYGDTAVSLGRAENSAVGNRSIAYGDNLVSSGYESIAFGRENTASSNRSIVFGNNNVSSGINSLVFGEVNMAIGNNSTSIGVNNVSVDDYSFTENCGNVALGYGSHAENCQNIAGAKYIFKIASYDTSDKRFIFDDTYEGFSDSFEALEVGALLHIANVNYINDASVYTVESVGVDGKSVTVKESIPTSNFKVAYAVLIKSGVNYRGCHAEGRISIALGNYSHAEGYLTEARGEYSHTEGQETVTNGVRSHAEGYRTGAYGYVSHAEGIYTATCHNYSHAEGSGSIAVNESSHAEGMQTIAGKGYILRVSAMNAENKTFVFSALYDGFEKAFSILSAGTKLCLIDVYYLNDMEVLTVNSVDSSTNSITVLEDISEIHNPWMAVVVKNYDGVTGPGHTEGRRTMATGYNSHAEGFYASASGDCSHAGGYYTEASNYASCAIGKCSAAMTNGKSNNTAGHALVIGNGTSESARSNAFSVMFDGTVKAKGTITASTAADYAEFFEWLDGNPNGEDRVGLFVTLDGENIRIANDNDDYILGIVSGMPCVLGNGDCDTWNGMYLRDDFNRVIMEPAPKMVEKENGDSEEVFDEDGNPVYESERPVLNPNYNPEQKYISRLERLEWSPVGMLGVLAVYDDGSCKVNGYCKCGKNGIATAADTGYRVIKRLKDNIVKVIFR